MREESLQLLISKLESKDSQTRAMAVKAMSGRNFDDVGAPLSRAIKDYDAMVRRQAALTLGTFSDYRAVAPLIRAMKDTDQEVRQAVALSFKSIASAHGGSNPAKSLEELSSEIFEEQATRDKSASLSGVKSDDFQHWAKWASENLSTGSMIEENAVPELRVITCGACGETVELPKMPKFCPNCGRPLFS